MTINHYFFSFFPLPLLFLFTPLRRRRPFHAILRLLLFLPSHARRHDIPFLFFRPYTAVRLLIIIILYYCCRALWFYGIGTPKSVVIAHRKRWCTIRGTVPYRCRYSGDMYRECARKRFGNCSFYHHNTSKVCSIPEYSYKYTLFVNITLFRKQNNVPTTDGHGRGTCIT